MTATSISKPCWPALPGGCYFPPPMDPICHTLVGASLAQAGLKRRTALGTATLLIGANLPDVDLVSRAWGTIPMLEWRRGWTHGVLALVALPMLLTGLVLAWDRVGRKRSSDKIPASAKQLLLLSGVAVLTHPTLDWLNTYGMRWLMPFSDRWYYGDALFIVDPWVWLVLAAGIVLSLSRERRHGISSPGRPALVALALVTVYILSMFGLSAVTARRLASAYAAHTGVPPMDVMAGPVPLNPLRRSIVIQTRDHYVVGDYSWLPAEWTESEDVYPTLRRGMRDSNVHQAVTQPAGRGFLSWTRFPTYTVEDTTKPSVVHLLDLRYATQPTAPFGAIAIPPTTSGRGTP